MLLGAGKVARVKRQVILGKPIPVEQVIALSKTLGGRIAIARHAAGMSQWDLCAKVHVSQPLISLWERNRVAPDDAAVRLIAKATGCTVSYLTTAPVVRKAA